MPLSAPVIIVFIGAVIVMVLLYMWNSAGRTVSIPPTATPPVVVPDLLPAHVSPDDVLPDEVIPLVTQPMGILWSPSQEYTSDTSKAMVAGVVNRQPMYVAAVRSGAGYIFAKSAGYNTWSTNADGSIQYGSISDGVLMPSTLRDGTITPAWFSKDVPNIIPVQTYNSQAMDQRTICRAKMENGVQPGVVTGLGSGSCKVMYGTGVLANTDYEILGYVR